MFRQDFWYRENILTQARQELREEVGWSARYSFDAPWDSTTPVDEKGATRLGCEHVVVQSCTNKVRLNWEHDAARWVSPEVLSKYTLIPGVRDLIVENHPR